jgi:hypothetical protein
MNRAGSQPFIGGVLVLYTRHASGLNLPTAQCQRIAPTSSAVVFVGFVHLVFV